MATQTLTLPFDGICTRCQGRIPKGSEVQHTTGEGVHHVECPESAFTPIGEAIDEVLAEIKARQPELED